MMSPQYDALQEPPYAFTSSSPAESVTLGQFSFAPATQTTVVTTTTTTTTKFPPFMMRAPRRYELDPKLYPLASAPTPASLKNICFNLAGKPTFFHETEDTTAAFEQLQEEQKSLRSSSGATQTVQSFQPQLNHNNELLSKPFASRLEATNRPASPVSIVEGPNNVRQPALSRGIRPRISSATRMQKERKTGGEQVLAPQPRHLRDVVPTTPLTKGTQRRRTGRWRGVTSMATDTFLDSPLSPEHDSRANRQILGAGMLAGPIYEQSNWATQHTPVPSKHPQLDKQVTSVETAACRQPSSNIVPTPPIEQDEQLPTLQTRGRRSRSSIPSRRTGLDSSSALDGSLPSPSLSPVTAAANLHHGGYFADVDSNSELASQQDHEYENKGLCLGDTPSHSRFNSPRRAPCQLALDQRGHQTCLCPPSFNDIPAMLVFFEAIPDELKSYVMHQLLRRCPKATLHVVADTVNPALKCDFLGILPPELSLNILKFLDVRSLCRASQVSKKWRHIINGDEKAWKELFDVDGYSLPEGELQRSIIEGWGWQDPFGPDGFEQDINSPSGLKSDHDGLMPTPSLQTISYNSLHEGNSRRPKRKAAGKLSTRNKQPKRKSSTRDTLGDFASVDWMSQMSTAEGPYNAANAAIIAVPYSDVGLSSLRDLHLYKSLYRRHYQIRKNWMREEAKPRHIAFRAHDRHVVTCLQFDTDKILTGSDDNNINVYDTKSGALRVVLRGHEGGVWALQYEGNVLVSGSTDRSVRVWNIENGQQMHVFRGHTSTVRCLQILMPTEIGETPEGKAIMMPRQPLIITGSRDSNLRVWRLPQAEDPAYIQPDINPQDDTDCPYFVRVLTGHQHSVRAIAAQADTLVSGSYDCTVRVWKISTGETVHRLQGHTQKVYSVVLDHNRNRCISGSMDNLVKIWSLDTGSVLHTLDGHSSLVGLLDLGCERLVSAAADSTLRIWDPENGQCKATLSAHTGAITCFQHDSQKVISGSDRTLKMWNVKTGECIKDLLTDLSGVWQVKFNERRCVAAVQRDNMTYIEVLDFGAARDGVPDSERGRRLVVDVYGEEAIKEDNIYLELDHDNSEP